MNRVTTTLLSALAAWCVFWWGYVAGMKSSAETDLDSAQTDIALQDAILKSRSNGRAAEDVYDELRKLRVERINELEQRVDVSIGDFLMAPVTAPIGAFALAHVRRGSANREASR